MVGNKVLFNIIYERFWLSGIDHKLFRQPGFLRKQFTSRFRQIWNRKSGVVSSKLGFLSDFVGNSTRYGLKLLETTFGDPDKTQKLFCQSLEEITSRY